MNRTNGNRNLRRAGFQTALLAGMSLTAASLALAQGAPAPAKKAAAAPAATGASKEWPHHLYDPSGSRYSPLTQITPANVTKLKLAWSIHLKPEGFVAAAGGRGGGRAAAPAAPGAAAAPAGGTPSGNGARNQSRFSEAEVTPIVVNGMMYVTSPYRKIMALDSSTGKQIWDFDGSGPTRGVEYWPGDKNTPPQIIFTANGGLMSLDAKTGKPNPKFNGLPPPAAPGAAAGGGGGGGGGSSPPIIYKNIIISGAANPFNDGRSGGDIRAFDAATGKQLWRFNTIPKKGEPGYETWAPGTAEYGGGVHIWGLMTLDVARGIVYAPINAPNWNRFGGDRPGDNLYSSSILALDANTGKLLWHFQVVHHDIWDMDADSPSTLFDVKKDGKVIPAIGVISKSALMFIMDRVTGKPIFGVEERPVPQSEVPGEHTSPTQPFPIKPPPLGRQTMSMDELAQLTPEHTAACADLIKKTGTTMGGPYMPPGYKHPTVNFPGPNASVNWGGGSFDPKLGYYIVNSQDLGQFTELAEKGTVPYQFNGVTGGNAPAGNDNIPYEMAGLNGRFKVLGMNMMCQAPPWGSLTAVNVNTGDIAWKVPLGITESLPADKQHTGRPSSGGSIVTASGLVFIGATDDARFRAFDARNGKELWTIKLPAGSHSVPATYMGKNGKQFVVFPATGGDFIEDPGADDELFAYALP